MTTREEQYQRIADAYYKLVKAIPFSLTTKGKGSILYCSPHKPSSVIVVDGFTADGHPLVTKDGTLWPPLVIHPDDVATGPKVYFNYIKEVEILSSLE